VSPGTGGWDLAWSYTCTSQPPSIFSFVVDVYQGPWRDQHDAAVSEKSTTGKGTVHYGDGGDFTLHVAGYPNICSWTVKATTPGG